MASNIEMIGQAEKPAIKVKSKNSVTKSRNASAPKNSALSFQGARNFFSGRIAAQLDLASSVA